MLTNHIDTSQLRPYWAIVAVKQWAYSKTRLSDCLSTSQRTKLSQAMLNDVLLVLTSSRLIAKVLLVGDEDELRDIAQRYPVSIFSDKHHKHDLNAALHAASSYARRQGAQQLCYVHSDLPLITRNALEQLLKRHANRANTLAIVTDRKGTGSNIVLLDAGVKLTLVFGQASRSKFEQQAVEKSVSVHTQMLPGLSDDIDEPDDFFKLQDQLLNDYKHAEKAMHTRLAMLSMRSPKKHHTAVKHSNNAAELASEWQTSFEHLHDDVNIMNLADHIVKQFSFNALLTLASNKRNQYWGTRISYSPKVFLPITQLCRDVCHYCTFAKTPKALAAPFMTVEQVLEVVREGKKLGCYEALLTLGEKPELRYRQAREWLNEQGFSSTVEYVAFLAQTIVQETGLLPHINAGCLTDEEYKLLKPVSASMGLMLESSSTRLCEKGMPHYGSPDKHPALRLTSIALAGQNKVPFTSGVLIGIGETRLERIQTLLALRQQHQKYQHVQEVIVQNFKPKNNTKMANAQAPCLQELQWTVAMARLLLPGNISVQVPPNLNTEHLSSILDAGINDWGGISPLTQDFVNPEAAWPSITALTKLCRQSGFSLQARLTIYPFYLMQSFSIAHALPSAAGFIDKKIAPFVLSAMDSEGWARQYGWVTGKSQRVPAKLFNQKAFTKKYPRATNIQQILDKVSVQEKLEQDDMVQLFQARGDDFFAVCNAANELRKAITTDAVTYVINRNINYTNICSFDCRFCAFSKGTKKQAGKEAAYSLNLEEIVQRAVQAWDDGATEVCLQGGIHPTFTGETYLTICSAIRAALPDIHIHAFSPLEVTHGANTLGISILEFLKRLKAAGLNTLPGTAAEILCDDVRDIICREKINTQQWLAVMRAAHSIGVSSTATIMFGHVEQLSHWAQHLMHVRDLQIETGGFTEFVPLPFVAAQSPLYLTGQSRQGPDLRESILMHAVSRLVLSPWIKNIQTSWVKMGEQGASLCLLSGANDLGGTLMNESITRAAGAQHGQHKTYVELQRISSIVQCDLVQRNTLYHFCGEQAQRLETDTLEQAQIKFKTELINPVAQWILSERSNSELEL